MIALANSLNTYCDKTERSHRKPVREKLEKSVDRWTILVIEFTKNEELIFQLTVECYRRKNKVCLFY